MRIMSFGRTSISVFWGFLCPAFVFLNTILVCCQSMSEVALLARVFSLLKQNVRPAPVFKYLKKVTVTLF